MAVWWTGVLINPPMVSYNGRCSKKRGTEVTKRTSFSFMWAMDMVPMTHNLAIRNAEVGRDGHGPLDYFQP